MALLQSVAAILYIVSGDDRGCCYIYITVDRPKTVYAVVILYNEGDFEDQIAPQIPELFGVPLAAREVCFVR